MYETWKSSQLITFDQDDGQLAISDGPDLPFKFRAHCFVKVNDDLGLLTAGIGIFPTDFGFVEDYSDKTLTFHIANQIWSLVEESVLSISRISPACGVVQDSGNQGLLVVVAGGNLRTDMTNSTETWSIDSRQWSMSADLPIPLNAPAGISRPDKSAFILLGGGLDRESVFVGNGPELSKNIFQFTCFDSECQWEKMDMELSEGRRSFTAMFVPRSMAENCF